MIIDGKEVPRRGSNKKYPELDDVDALYERVRKDQDDPICITDLARELGVPQNSIRHRLLLLSEEKRDNFYMKRKPHRRKVGKRKLSKIEL